MSLNWHGGKDRKRCTKENDATRNKRVQIGVEKKYLMYTA